MVTNLLSEAAVYLGDETDEVIVAKAGSPFLHFTWHGDSGRLTGFSDPYGNRLTVRSDRQGRPAWVENGGAGPSSRLRGRPHHGARVAAF